MHRRLFLQSLSALAATPALPAIPAAPVANAAPRMTIAQQLWASYFKSAKGRAAIHRVQTTLGLPSAQAKQIVMRSVAQGRGPLAVVARGAGVAASAPRAPTPKITNHLTHLMQDRVPHALRNLRAMTQCDCDGPEQKPEPLDPTPLS